MFKGKEFEGTNTRPRVSAEKVWLGSRWIGIKTKPMCCSAEARMQGENGRRQHKLKRKRKEQERKAKERKKKKEKKERKRKEKNEQGRKKEGKGCR